jgi:DNA-binding NarL/FixJ family response regulator
LAPLFVPKFVADASSSDVPARVAWQTAMSAAVVARDRRGLDRLCELLELGGLEVTHRLRRPAVTRLPQGDRAPDAIVYSVDGASAGWETGIAAIRKGLPRSGVVVVAPDAARCALRAALRAGADGFVIAAEMESTLAVTVKSVCAGQVSVPQSCRVEMERTALSYREKQVLGMVVLGLMNAQIADRLCLAESTVKCHLSSAFAKLGVHSRNEAATLILDPQQDLAGCILGIAPDLSPEPVERAEPKGAR